MIVSLWLALQTVYFQNWIVKRIAKNFSSNLGTEITLERVELRLFNQLDLRGLLVRDRQKDTLLYAGTLRVNINDWFFVKDRIILHYIGLSDARIMLQREDSTWNHQFLLDYFGGGQKKSGGNVKLALEKVELDRIHFIQKDGWRGEDQEWGVEKLSLDADLFDTDKKTIHINSIDIANPVFKITNYDGNKPARLKRVRPLTRYTNDTAHLRWNPDRWKIAIDDLQLTEGRFMTSEKGRSPEGPYFDGSNIDFFAIDGSMRNIRLQEDSITGLALLRTKERSGFEVTRLQTQLRFHPEAMEFDSLELETPKSRLHNYFAMRYATFDDLGYFISRVTMEGDFDEAELHSDDIAYFAPALKNWKTAIRITGKVKGPVDDLSAKNLVVRSGNNTFLNGSIRMRGLPDIDNTYMDFDANEFSTTYADAVALLPQLKKISEPRLPEMKYLRFKGNFAGFFHDFVTYGILETGLGTVVSDLNMKFRQNGNVNYSGTLMTPGFEIGNFTGYNQLGKIAFKGKVSGSGLEVKTIKANLNGSIQQLEFKGYAYKDMQIDGLFSNKKFNGNFTSNDPNLIGSLSGIIDLQNDIPHFDLLAYIDKIDFKKTNLSRENIDFKGVISLDFFGDDLDNFNGTALIKEADLYHDGLRLPFDSLRLSTALEGDRKTISLRSNELDAALSGKFSVRELPAALNGMLNKYFPSIFAARDRFTTSEDFIFYVYAKNIQDYLHLFDQPWKGFNYSTFSGRVNDQQNIIDLEVEIPQFQYNKTIFYDLKIKGNGNSDRLGLAAGIGLIELNENNSFPGTRIDISSFKDTSFIKLNTSANQTLNAANITSRVITSKNGVGILFGPSDFELNGKKWYIQENGELILTKELVSAEGVKIFNGQQEIAITSSPSDISNTNDIKVRLQKINIGDFSSYLLRSNRLEGLLSGEVDIIDPFGKLKVEMLASAEHFQLDSDSIGTMKLGAQFNRSTGRLAFTGISANEEYRFDVNGNYNLADSATEKILDISANIEHTRIDLLERFLSDVFSEMGGYAKGNLRIVGPPENLDYLGTVQLEKGKVKVGYTNVTYQIPQATVQFKEDRIDLGSFYIEDTLGNKGFLSKGIIKHQGFKGMEFDFSLNTNKLLALNTSNAANDPYYGKIIAKASLNLTGPMDDMVMSIKGQPADSSFFFIKSGSSRESGEADFIVWKTYGTELQEEYLAKNGKLTILMDLAANNLVNMNVIIDELTNDIMSAVGHGNLRIKATTAGEFEMNGQIDIDQGNYNFNFQSLLRKPFKLAGEAGNYLRWNGDPYNADIKVTAEYKADNVKFSNLGDQLYLQTGSDVEYIKKFRGEVRVLAYLTGQLMRPDIRFSLQMPENSPLRNDPLVSNLLNRIQSDENELNKQVAFLLIFNNFGPLAASSQSGLGSQAWEGLVSSSISGLISNQLSKQFSSIIRKVFNDESIKVNFNAQLYNGAFLLSNGATSNFNIDRTNLNFSLAKSMFEERLTFSFGSAVDFGLTSAQARAANNLQFLPDITAMWKLRADGKLLLSFFYRDTYNYQSATGKQNRSGAGITFRRDFEHFNELWRNEKKKKKTTRPVIPALEAEKSTTRAGEED